MRDAIGEGTTLALEPTMSKSETHPPTEAESFETLRSVLADSDCRAIIIQLRAASVTTASLATLTSAIATPAPTDRDHARRRLTDTLLPKLTATSLLTYDPDTATVHYHGHPELDAVLHTINNPNDAHPSTNS